MAIEPRRVNVARRSFTVEYQSGVAEAEAGMSVKNIIGIDAASRSDGFNFRTNQVTLANYNDTMSQNAAGAIGLAATKACVDLLAGTIASLPLMVYQSKDGVREAAKAHPLYRVLHDSPNRDQTAVDYWEYSEGALELHGNSFSSIDRSGKNVVALTPINPESMFVKRLSGGSLEYRWTEGTVERVGSSADVFHIRGPFGNGLIGASPLSLCRRAFGSALAVDSSASSMFGNGARPSGILKIAAQLTAEQRPVLEKALNDKFVGAINAGRPMLLDNGAEWQQLTINPNDAQMLESRRFSVEEICRIFGVPPHMVGHTEKTTSWGTGLEQQTIGFVQFTLRRRLKRIEQAIEKQLLSVQDRASGVTVEFNLEGLLRGDSASRAAFYASGLQNGWRTINEVRAYENLPPVDGGDTPRMQMQNVPITEAGAVPPPAGSQP